jgi:hypothetical protein
MFELLTEMVSNQRVTDDTWLMGLRSAEIAQTAKPGQFVMIRVRPGLDPLLRRPFSICGVRDDLLRWGKALPRRKIAPAAFWSAEESASPPFFFLANSTGRRKSLS